MVGAGVGACANWEIAIPVCSRTRCRDFPTSEEALAVIGSAKAIVDTNESLAAELGALCFALFHGANEVMEYVTGASYTILKLEFHKSSWFVRCGRGDRGAYIAFAALVTTALPIALFRPFVKLRCAPAVAC